MRQAGPAAAAPPVRSPPALAVVPEVSHNLVGQRLGRKGMETRERILAAAIRLLQEPGETPVTLTGVARAAAVGMTTLYLYFPDLGELVLAALGRVMDTIGGAFLDRLRERWPDDRLDGCCLDFLQAHFGFWRRHARLLGMRNQLADASDPRLLAYRNSFSRPIIGLLVKQMDGCPDETDSRRFLLAMVLHTGVERLATVLTNANWRCTARASGVADEADYVGRLLEVEAELLASAIRGKRLEARACAS